MSEPNPDDMFPMIPKMKVARNTAFALAILLSVLYFLITEPVVLFLANIMFVLGFVTLTHIQGIRIGFHLTMKAFKEAEVSITFSYDLDGMEDDLEPIEMTIPEESDEYYNVEGMD
jgi:hypothetical protein